MPLGSLSFFGPRTPRKGYHRAMSELYTYRPLDPRNTDELDAVVCFSIMTLWESRPEIRHNPKGLPGYSWSETHALYRAGINSKDQRYLVALGPDGNLAGSSVVVMRTNAKGQPYGYFWSRYVLPEHRRCGMARRFLHDNLNWFRSRKAAYAEVHIHVENRLLRSLFESEKFKVEDRGHGPFTWLVLRRHL